MYTEIDYSQYKHSYAHALEPKLKVIRMSAAVNKKPVNYIKAIIRNTLNDKNNQVIWTEKEQYFFDNVMLQTDSLQLYYYCKNAVECAKRFRVQVDEQGELADKKY